MRIQGNETCVHPGKTGTIPEKNLLYLGIIIPVLSAREEIIFSYSKDFSRFKQEKTMFRRVYLPTTITGNLYLTSMPGRFEPVSEWKERMIRLSIGRLICLNPIEELSERSPEYYRHINRGDFPWKFIHFPIPDFGIPADRQGFLALERGTAAALRSGVNIVVHCTAGIGRTGTFAMVLLMVLGMNRDDAAAAVRQAEARPEGINQRDFIDWCELNL